MTQDDAYLVKLKQLGVPQAQIAAKLGKTEAQIDEMWKAITTEVAHATERGYQSLVERWTMLCHQYQLVGESLKVIGGALSEVMTEKELLALVESAYTKKDLVQVLMTRAIVLRPFVAPPVMPPAENVQQN